MGNVSKGAKLPEPKLAFLKPEELKLVHGFSRLREGRLPVPEGRELVESLVSYFDVEDERSRDTDLANRISVLREVLAPKYVTGEDIKALVQLIRTKKLALPRSFRSEMEKIIR